MPTNFHGKSFILSGDGYKKWTEGSNGELSDLVSKIPTMTSKTSPSGETLSSGDYDNTRTSWKAFNGEVDLYTYSWTSTAIMPSFLGYDFGSGVSQKIVAYELTSPSNNSSIGTDKDSMPKNWEFQGSNDNATWKTLSNETNQQNWGNSETRLFKVYNFDSYRYYRIYITENNRASSEITYVAEFKMYGGSISEYSPKSWKTVSQSPPTLPQFKEEGMDNLAILDRKVTTVLDSPLPMTSSELGEGKVFKQTINLKKYFDLRKLEVK